MLKIKQGLNINTAVIIICTAILTGLGHSIASSISDRLTWVAAIPDIQRDLKELTQHRCKCGDSVAKSDPQSVIEAYRKYQLSTPKQQP